MSAKNTLLLCCALSASAYAHDYPTVDRVEYVLECLKNNGGAHEYLYKCACAIDTIAKALPYDDYVSAATVARYQGMGGERSGVFRDPEPMKEMANRYRKLHADAKKECAVTR